MTTILAQRLADEKGTVFHSLSEVLYTLLRDHDGRALADAKNILLLEYRADVKNHAWLEHSFIAWYNIYAHALNPTWGDTNSGRVAGPSREHVA